MRPPGLAAEGWLRRGWLRRAVQQCGAREEGKVCVRASLRV